nr:MAG TPA: hypothetical protein [Caudoviricetes sp.]
MITNRHLFHLFLTSIILRLSFQINTKKEIIFKKLTKNVLTDYANRSIIYLVSERGGKETPMKFKDFKKLNHEEQRKKFEQYKKEWLAARNN